MNSKIFLTILSLLIISSISASTLYLNASNISSDVYLGKLTIPSDYYSFIQWDLNGSLDSNNPLDIYNVEANLSVAVTGGFGDRAIEICLVKNQDFNLSAEDVPTIYNSFLTSTDCISSTLTNVFNGKRYYIDVSYLLRRLLNYDRNANYFTLSIVDTDYDSIAPNQKIDDSELRIGNDTSFLVLGSKTFPTSLYKPRLEIYHNPINPNNISMRAGENWTLPRTTSNKSYDNEGLERTLLYCVWGIDSISGMENMTGNYCPSSPISWVFNSNEVYAINIYYADIFWNTTSSNWELKETGLSGGLEYHYLLDVPEPSASFIASIWSSIWNTIKSWICSLFPSLGICS